MHCTLVNWYEFKRSLNNLSILRMACSMLSRQKKLRKLDFEEKRKEEEKAGGTVGSSDPRAFALLFARPNELRAWSSPL